jgi:hypothetical protein
VKVDDYNALGNPFWGNTPIGHYPPQRPVLVQAGGILRPEFLLVGFGLRPKFVAVSR